MVVMVTAGMQRKDKMLKVTAEHANGYVRCALCATSMEDAMAKKEGLIQRGYWLNIQVVEFAPRAK